MLMINSRLMALTALSAALLAGCGGSSDYGSDGAQGQPFGPVAQTVTDVVAYINNLIADTADNTEPVDINSLTLTADNGAESAPLP